MKGQAKGGREGGRARRERIPECGTRRRATRTEGASRGRGGMEGVGACARISHVSPRIRERGSPRARDFLPLQCRARFRTRRLARRRLCQGTTRSATHSPTDLADRSHAASGTSRSARSRDPPPLPHVRVQRERSRGRSRRHRYDDRNGRSNYKRGGVTRRTVESSISTEARWNVAWYASMIVRTEHHGRRFTSK